VFIKGWITMVLYANANVAIFAVLGCTQLVLVVSYRHLGKTCRSRAKQSKENWINGLS